MPNAALSSEQRYHLTKPLHRKYKTQLELKMPSVANLS
ncbi:hypothetical protein M565_ctg1P1057 [Vibrio cyclitrophicus FF75]|nr:hypothetical protein M565_ctg1P1057 [Vibrio cyclitrophicus FF75]